MNSENVVTGESGFIFPLQPLESEEDILLGVPITSIAALGLGYKRRTNSMMNQVVDVPPTDKPEASTEIRYAFDYVETYEELHSKLNVSISASYGAVGAAGGSASLSIARSTAMSFDAAYVVFKMSVIAKKSILSKPMLDKDALKLLLSGSGQDFYQKYGGHFVRSLYYGGELACIMQFTSTSQASSEAFRAEIKAAVGLAKGEATYESAVTKLTTGRTVHIIYAQTGGGTGRPKISSGMNTFPLTPEELIERMQNFPSEVIGLDGTNGRSVALYADMFSVREAHNCPSGKGLNLEPTYPGSIDQIAGSISLLKEKLVTVEKVLFSTTMTGPSDREAAAALRPYLRFAIQEASTALASIMATTQPIETFVIESFFQYRLRNLMGLSSSTRSSNAGPRCDLAEHDKGLLEEMLFGKIALKPIQRWPELAYTGQWGFMSDDDRSQIPGLFVGTRINCGDTNPGEAQAVADRLAGKTGPDDGVFAFFTGHPFGAPGGHCGAHIFHFAGIRILKPEVSILPQLPLLPVAQNTRPIPSLGLPIKLGETLWKLPFGIHTSCTTSCGSYTISARIVPKEKNKEPFELSETSYWYKKDQAELALEHLIKIDGSSVISDFSVTVNDLYCNA